MSTAKRSKRRQAESHQASASPLPASKRLKSTHVPAQSGLGFLVDEDARAGKKIEAKLTNGTPRSKSTRVDESNAAVATSIDEDNGSHKKQKIVPEVIDITSGEEESSELEEEDDDDEEEEDAAAQEPMPTANGHVEEEDDAAVDDADMEDADGGDQQDEPTFGDLLQARHPDPIDVGKALQDAADQDSRGLVPMSGASAGHSLGTVLTQALKTNDKDLLESCFAETDPSTIRRTIARQKSHEIAILLERIAEKIHRKPGRTGNLLVWVQWSLVAHGGYLANQPELMTKVKALAQVVRQRAAGLQPLLHLKGKLDLLHAQLDFRRDMQADSRVANAEDLDDPNGVLYIEGEDHDSSDSDDAADEGDEIDQPRKQKAKQGGRLDIDQGQDEEMDILPNGLGGDAENDSSDDEDDADLDGMLDIEAEEGSDNDEEESSNEEAESEEEEDEEEDESDGDESDTITVKQPKPNTLNRKR
ncbi:hypothetical protein M409DRAFT_17011 [Zasmidium cellare ATCC 36951]|uniref:Small-subunit processome Utp12 domain-containing protein n=1 Tax=Zasmidium cellare ATCC 36951 TaxID=1080233 RepID=A0A6A6D125_ZASCE|nr:uncharacterized protein M409DRAFT_17011 [Zasmidium cellare ATCC 36951]KAF2173061.1 hypothetical protein M409DRAFT_17011 [Zasmidium cellare ATCC 36951]